VNHLRPTTDSDVQALTAHSTCYLSLLAVNKKTTQTQKTTRDAWHIYPTDISNIKPSIRPLQFSCFCT